MPILSNHAPERHLRLVPPPRPAIQPGPTPDQIPGHPAWCTLHDNHVGYGEHVCIGDTLTVAALSPDRSGASIGAGLVTATHEPVSIDVAVDGRDGPKLTPASARAFAEILLRLADEAEAGLAVAA